MPARPPRDWSPRTEKRSTQGSRPHHPRSRDDRPSRTGDDRPGHGRSAGRPGDDRVPRSRDDRPRWENRPPRSRDDRAPRAAQVDRPRDDRPRWENRPPRSRDDRPRWEDRTPRARDDRPRDDRPRDDRPRNDRPAWDRSERSPRPPRFSDDRPRRDRDDRPRRDRQDRPRRDRDDRAPRAPRVPELTGPNAFVDLGVSPRLAAVLAQQEIVVPTPIQDLTIPAALAGRDVLGRGRTGSGKTLAFTLPLLTRLDGPRDRMRTPRALVLAPTRELAMQVVDVSKPLAAALGMRVQLVIGGSSYDRQIRGLERADLVVATPGRLVDLAERGAVDLSKIEVVVLDEADHMADLGFMAEIEAIMDRLPADAQHLLFSATLDHDVDRLVRTYLNDPLEHNADPASATVSSMEHHVVLVHPRDKDAVTNVIAARRGRTVAFVRTQLGADRLAEQLDAEGVSVAALHGGMKQGARTRTLEDFRSGRISLLVATDVAARGLHVDDIDLVVHVDPPHGPKEYLHRSGRTARAGASGTVVSIATNSQSRMVHAITSKAGVNPTVLRARPGDEALRQLVS